MRTGKKKPLYTKKVTYVPIYKLVARDNPLTIETTETYFPYRGEGHDSDYSRVKQRKKTINIITPATHEIHLTNESITKSLENMDCYGTQIAALFTIYGNTSKLRNRPSGSSVYIYGPSGQERAYFVLNWKQVLPVPDYKDRSVSSAALRDRFRYPTTNFGRIDDGRKVYYLQAAEPEEFKIIVGVLA